MPPEADTDTVESGTEVEDDTESETDAGPDTSGGEGDLIDRAEQFLLRPNTRRSP